MITGRPLLMTAFAGLLAATGLARGAVDCSVREGSLPHICKGGPTPGNPCTPIATNPVCSDEREAENNACGDGTCIIDVGPGRATRFRARLTIVVDENVSELDGSDPSPANTVAVTVLLDLGRKGVVAETYQNLAAPVNPPSDFYGTTVSKDLLRLAALICSNNESPCTGDGDCGAGNTCDPGGKMAEIVNAFVFRTTEHGIAAALRGVLGATEGVPVVTKVSSVGLSDASDAAASVLRMKIKGELVACMQNGGSCREDVFCCSGNCDLSGGSPGVCG